jgi:hypothetical protein
MNIPQSDWDKFMDTEFKQVIPAYPGYDEKTRFGTPTEVAQCWVDVVAMWNAYTTNQTVTLVDGSGDISSIFSLEEVV